MDPLRVGGPAKEVVLFLAYSYTFMNDCLLS